MENSDDTVKLPRIRQGRRNRRVLYGIGAVAALLVAAAATVWIRGASAGSEPKRERVQVQTVAIVRTDLSTDHTLTGSLGFGTARPVRGGREGVVTWLPATGTSVKRGQTLYGPVSHSVVAPSS